MYSKVSFNVSGTVLLSLMRGSTVLVRVTECKEPTKKMVHLRYFKCNGRTNESASSLAIGPLTSSSTTGRISSDTKPNENRTSKPGSPNITNSSSTNQLLINSNRPIHTVSASDGQVVRIVRQWFSNIFHPLWVILSVSIYDL